MVEPILPQAGSPFIRWESACPVTDFISMRNLAGTAGFEPTDIGAKILCLTAWRCPFVCDPSFAAYRSHLFANPVGIRTVQVHHACTALPVFPGCRKENKMKKKAIWPLESVTGLEPAATCLEGRCSTIELHRHIKITTPPGWSVTTSNYTPTWNLSSASTTPQLSFYPSADIYPSLQDGLFASLCDSRAIQGISRNFSALRPCIRSHP